MWAWLDLLIVPFFIAVSVYGLGLLQALAQQRVEAQRAEQTTLQAYLEQMSTWLIDSDLRTSKDIDVRNAARARTLTTLDALNPERKRRVLRFLEETKLLRPARLSQEESITNDCQQDKVPSVSQAKRPVISLRYACLSGVELGRHGVLGGIDLQQADLASAAISNANLTNTSLRGANLFETNLSSTDLTGADLRGACLANANLSGADLTSADISQEQLDQVKSLEGATMPNE